MLTRWEKKYKKPSTLTLCKSTALMATCRGQTAAGQPNSHHMVSWKRKKPPGRRAGLFQGHGEVEFPSPWQIMAWEVMGAKSLLLHSIAMGKAYLLISVTVAIFKESS